MKHESVDDEMEVEEVKTEDMVEADKEEEAAESGKDVSTPAENGGKPDSVEAPLPLRMNLRERSVAAFQSLKSKPVDQQQSRISAPRAQKKCKAVFAMVPQHLIGCLSTKPILTKHV